MTVRQFVGVAPLNQQGATTYPPVVCQRKGPAFQWHDGKDWQQGDELPAEIANALPGPVWSRCQDHAWRRMGGRKGAA